jgi:hypothetical protein
MPSLRLLLNIGSRDAQALGLDETREGQTVSVSDKVAAELIGRGWAAAEGATGPAPEARPSSSTTPRPGEAQVEPGKEAEASRGLPTVPAPTAPAEEAPDLGAMTKAELEEYAKDMGIEGVSMSQTKDEMVATIEDALTQ